MNQAKLFESDGNDNREKVDETRECRICKKELPLTSQFYAVCRVKASDGKKTLRKLCKKCEQSIAKVTTKLKETTPAPDQDYRCPICTCTKKQIKERELGAHKSRIAWCLDHDHSTGLFRGWLCFRCNIGLGHFEDDLNMVKNAVKYLS